MLRQDPFRKNLYVLAIVTLLCFGPLKWRVIFETLSDYTVHLAQAQTWWTKGHLHAPHFAFQALTIAVYWLVRSWQWAGVIVDLGSYVATALILQRFLSLNRNRLEQVFIPFSALLLWPIALLWFVDHELYQGYLATNVYYNPTMVLLKPLALLIFFKVRAVLENYRWTPNLKQGLLLAGLSILAALAKPNFSIILLPTLLVLPAVFHGRINLEKIKWLFFFVGVPTVTILTYQYLIAFLSSPPSGQVALKRGIGWAPFEVFSYHSGWLLPKFFLSIVFPLAVFSFFTRKAWNDVGMRVASLLFGGGVFFTYMIVETGSDKYSGNFCWSGQIGTFVLFVASLDFLLRHRKESPSNRSGLRWVWAAWWGHVAFGIVVVLFEFFSRTA